MLCECVPGPGAWGSRCLLLQLFPLCHILTSRSLPPLPTFLWRAGRAAMIGFAALLAVEAVKGSALF